MKKFNRKDALKYVNKKVKEIEKKGLDVNFLLKGKTPEQHAWSKSSLDQFKKQVKRTIERPNIQAEVKELNVQRQKRRFLNVITQGTKDIVNFTQKGKLAKEIISGGVFMKGKLKKQVKKELFYLKEKYFMELKGTKYEKRVNDLIKSFGARLDLAHDFIDFVANSEYVYPFEKDTYQKSMASDYHDHMIDRLLDFEEEARRMLKLN